MVFSAQFSECSIPAGLAVTAVLKIDKAVAMFTAGNLPG